MKYLKVLMSVLNVLYWLLGGAILGTGIWLLVDEAVFGDLQDLITEQEWNFDIALYVIISAGSFLLLIGILGCIGTFTGNKIIRIIYSVCVSIVIIVELALIASISFILIEKYRINEKMYSDIQENYVNEYSTDSLSIAWNKMQIEWKCCGSNNFRDYYNSNFQSSQSQANVLVPWTCCKLKDNARTVNATKDDVKNYDECQIEALTKSGTEYDFLNSEGCYYELQFWMDLGGLVTHSVLFALVTIQILGIGMSCGLRKKKKRQVEPTKMI